MKYISIEDLKLFCKEALEMEGMAEKDAKVCAEVLTETDAFGTHSHGTKNLHNYIRKKRAGGVDFQAVPEVCAEGPSFAVIDAHNAMGMISSCFAMDAACEKAARTGIAIAAVKNSCHFGAAGYYANMAAKRGMIGISMSNVDPNMTVPGAREMVIGNNPLAYAVPCDKQPSIFLDIAMSNVASLKVVQARKDGVSIPATWIVDKDGIPTTDPSHYPEEGAMQSMAAHKGYGLAVLVELLTGGLTGGGISVMNEIVSWCFQMDKPNNVCHTFIAIDPSKFGGRSISERMGEMADRLHSASKAKGAEHIYIPGEIEWERRARADKQGVELTDDVYAALHGLAEENGLVLKAEEV